MTMLPDALREHLSGDVTTICHCWRLTRGDGAVLGFTDTDSEIEFDGVTHRPRSGFSASEAGSSLGLAADTVDIEGALSSLDIVEQDIHGGLYDGALVDTFLVNWQSPDQRTLIRSAVIGRIRLVDGRFVAELESISASLDKPNARYFRRGCDAELGDPACGFDIAAAGYNVNGIISSVEPAGAVMVAGIGTFAEGWFAHGLMSWTAAGRSASARVVSHMLRNGEARLMLAPGEIPAQGTAVVLVAGCDKRFSTCKGKFSNHLNFRGFPHLPGNDAAYGYVTEDLPLDGKPIVP